MDDADFIGFHKIDNIDRIFMNITQKIHGSNAQVFIFQEKEGFELKTGCRTRWISPENDNFGFSRFIYDHKDEFIEKLGPGRHFGEWAGPGINSGEGLKEKTFFLFNHNRWNNELLPERVKTVPHLYKGKFSHEMIELVFEELKINGSKIISGYMKPEGIVVELDGHFYKKVFNPEETGWTKKDKTLKVPRTSVDIEYLLQPFRLEQLLSRDEAYKRNFPYSLASICKDYVADLESENQLPLEREEAEIIKKAIGKNIFQFVKKQIAG
jgi:hypothetical protein